MDELYTMIENRISAGGYSKPVSGIGIYNQISDEIEGKENGTYLFFANQADSVVFEYKVDVMEEQFNLSYLHITDHGQEFHINFDEE